MMLDLIPTNQKSFYGKAQVEVLGDKRVLWSYGTPIMEQMLEDGELHRYEWMFENPRGEWVDWGATTGKHIRAFCGLCKKDYMKLPVVERN